VIFKFQHVQKSTWYLKTNFARNTSYILKQNAQILRTLYPFVIQMPHLNAVAQLSCFCSPQMHRLITIIHIASAIRHCTSILSESQIPRVHHALFICAAMCDFRRDKSGNCLLLGWPPRGQQCVQCGNADRERVTASLAHLFTQKHKPRMAIAKGAVDH